MVEQMLQSDLEENRISVRKPWWCSCQSSSLSMRMKALQWLHPPVEGMLLFLVKDLPCLRLDDGKWESTILSRRFEKKANLFGIVGPIWGESNNACIF